MADTPRALSAILALLADNVIGDISPQDLRDAIVSMLGEYAEIYLHDGSTAQTGVTTTPTKMTGFATNGADEGNLVADAANDQIDVSESMDVLVLFQCSFSGGANTTWQFHARISGVEQVASACERKLGAGGDVGSCSFICLCAGLVDTDTIEVFVESDQGGGASFTPTMAQLAVRRIR